MASPEAIRNGHYALPNGDTFYFEYDSADNITIGLPDFRYRVVDFSRDLNGGLQIHIAKEQTHGS